VQRDGAANWKVIRSAKRAEDASVASAIHVARVAGDVATSAAFVLSPQAVVQ